MEGGEHWFHTPDQMAFLDRWVTDSMEAFAHREDPTASAAMLLGMESPIEVHNPGGTNRIVFTRLDDSRFSMRLGGPVAVVAKGELGPDA